MALYDQLKQKEDLQLIDRKRDLDYIHMEEAADQKRLEREEAEKNKRLRQKQLLKDGLQEQINHKILPNKGVLPHGGMSEEERR